MKKIYEFILKNPLIPLVFLYLIFRFPNLTLLPIFNDEAIYLDWGWRETHISGQLYYSLYDAKQPLIMWLFGISSSIFSDPLFAGRFVSLFFGLLTTIGIYFLGRELFNKKTAILASITYILVPIFTLFDRLALMESAIASVGIWGLYFVLKSLEKERSVKNEIFAGIILGLGFFSKSTALLFLATTILIFFLKLIESKDKLYLLRLIVIISSFTATIFLLLINPQFWETLPSNSRYVYSMQELMKFPISSWFQNINALFQVSFFFITPIIFIISLFQIAIFIKRRDRSIALLWLFVPIIIVIFTLRIPSQRYLVSLLPIFLIFFASFFEGKIFKNNFKFVLLLSALIVSTIMSIYLIYKPLFYFQTANKATVFSEHYLINGQLSGYGFDETVKFLEQENLKNPIVVTYALNTGNPESGLSVYLSKKKLANGYFELKFLADTSESDCIELQSGQDLYFVSRNEQLAGFEKYVKKVKTFNKPFGNDSIGVYKFNKGCSQPLKINPTGS